MHVIHAPSANSDVFAFCDQWLRHLANADFVAARGMLVPDGRIHWTPELIEQLVSNYGTTSPHPSGQRFRVTAPESAAGVPNLSKLRIDPDDDECTGEVHSRYPFAVYWFRDGPVRDALGWVHLGYPLNGKWSDLSSEIWIITRGESLAFDLERIEIM